MVAIVEVSPISGSCEALVPRGLDPSELVQMSQVSRVKTVPTPAGRYQECVLARRSLVGLRRSPDGVPPPERYSRIPWCGPASLPAEGIDDESTPVKTAVRGYRPGHGGQSRSGACQLGRD